MIDGEESMYVFSNEDFSLTGSLGSTTVTGGVWNKVTMIEDGAEYSFSVSIPDSLPTFENIILENKHMIDYEGDGVTIKEEYDMPNKTNSQYYQHLFITVDE